MHLHLYTHYQQFRASVSRLTIAVYDKKRRELSTRVKLTEANLVCFRHQRMRRGRGDLWGWRVSEHLWLLPVPLSRRLQTGRRQTPLCRWVVCIFYLLQVRPQRFSTGPPVSSPPSSVNGSANKTKLKWMWFCQTLLLSCPFVPRGM